VVAAAATVAAAVVIARSLADRSLWIDEALSVEYARQSLPDLLSFFVHGELNMALYHLLLHYWLHVASSEAGLRAPSAAFAVATIPLAYLLGVRLRSSVAGAIAAVAFALNGVFLAYGRETRSYALVVFLIVAGAYCAVRAHESDRTMWWAAYVASMTLAAYAHFFSLFVLAAHLLSLGVAAHGRRRRVHGVLATGAVLLLATPIFAYVAQGHSGLTTDTTTSIADVPHLFEWYAGSNRPLLLVYACAAFAGVVALLRGARTAADGAWPAIFLLSWLVVPIAGALVASYTIDPLFEDRYFLVTLPALVLLVAIGSASLRPLVVTVAFLVLFAAVSARSLVLCQGLCGPPTQDFRDAEAFIASHAAGGDRIVFDPPYLRAAYAYYASRRGGGVPVAKTVVGRWSRIWLVDDLGDPNRNQYAATLRDLGRRSVKRQARPFPERLVVTLYAKRGAHG
jgi:uncharacterized membrane protein